MEETFTTGQEQIISALVYGIIFLTLVTTGLLLFFHYSRKKILQKELEKKSLELKYQQHILQASIAAQEEERTRIAQDLHDDVSAKLNVISLTTHVLLDDPGIPPEQKMALQHIVSVTNSTLESARKIAHDLMPAVLDKFGLAAALAELFEEFTKSTSIHIEHKLAKLSSLTPANELHIFRIIQELINNSIRHGNADVLTVKMEQNTNGFSIHYHDNGKGFNSNTVKKSTGIGLQNIRSRTAILNGTLHIKSVPHQGSTFTIHCIQS